MLQPHQRPLFLLCAVGAVGTAFLSCAQHVNESPAVTTDAGTVGSTTSGVGGAGGAALAGGASSLGVGAASAGAGGCVFPTPDDSGGDAGLPAQSWCAPVANPPECPVERPLAGSACSTAGLQCAYEKTLEGLLLDTCDQSWLEVAHWCNRTCTPSGSSVATPQQPGCGTLADIQCAGGATATSQERADRTLREIAACCGVPNETILVVWLEDGCASAASGPPELVSCMNGLLAGRRLDCAKELSCVMSEWSTLP